MTKKPSILTILLVLIAIPIGIIFDVMLPCLKIDLSAFNGSIQLATAALLLGLIYAKFNKDLLSKNQKIKISLYMFLIFIILYTFAITVLTDIFHKPIPFVIVDILMFLSSYISIFLMVCCMCPAFSLGGKIINPEMTTDKTKLKDFLLIIFFIALMMLWTKLGKIAIDIITPTIMEHSGYIRRNANSVEIEKAHFENRNLHANKLIINQNYTSIYKIAINEPIELDFLSKQKVFDIRKKHAAMSPAFIPANYMPSDTVFGQIQDNKPWWGLNGMMFKGAGQHSIDGLSEESRAINNPLLLFMVDPKFWFVDLKLKGSEIYPKPISITFQPSQKTIKVVYNFTDYDAEMNNYLKASAHTTFGNSNEYTLVGLNARDFGYNYAYAYSTQNVVFNDNSNNNLSTNIQQLQDFLHTGGSCGYAGGCNNRSPAEKFLDFTQLKLPAQIAIKLWKKMPQDKNAPADLYFIITLQ